MPDNARARQINGKPRRHGRIRNYGRNDIDERGLDDLCHNAPCIPMTISQDRCLAGIKLLPEVTPEHAR